MRYSIVGSLLYCAAAVHAFRDASPFLFFSSSALAPSSMQQERQEVQTASSVLQATKDFLRTCPSDLYIIIQQPALAASDLSAQGAVPHLRAAINDPRVQVIYSVTDMVAEDLDIVQELDSFIASSCGQNVVSRRDVSLSTVIDGAKNIVVANLESLSTDPAVRAGELADQDALINTNFFEHLSNGPEYTVIYTTTPVGAVIDSEDVDAAEPIVYDAQFDATEHLDLKRDFRVRADNSTNSTDNRPLFEKYQFFTPGIFMGLLVGLLLLSILSVGLNAIGSLKVSYGAFDKEMGPAAQKKQQ
ncbi:ER protein BIG1 [Rutstroemia sp. NJR-2017a WRK4]|nr:ER protein BIG1 [Rutstroemia sp. NJR-2017a WRK4]